MRSYPKLVLTAVFFLTGCAGDREVDLRAMVAQGVEKARSEGVQFFESETVQVETVVQNNRATVTLRDSGMNTRPSWGPDLTDEDLRWETTYELHYVYNDRWRLTGGKSKSKDSVAFDFVPESLTKYFDP